MKFIKKYWKCFLAIIAVIILLTLFVARITRFSVSEFPVSTNNDWIGYFGAITGGMLTLIGVVITIEYNDKQRKMDVINSVVPIFTFEIDMIEGKIAGCDSIGNISKGNYTGVKKDAGFGVKLKNIGLGNAYEFNFSIRFDENEYKKDIWGITNVDKDYKINNSIAFQIEEPVVNLNHEFEIKLTFEDVFGDKYEQKYRGLINVQKGPEDKLCYQIKDIKKMKPKCLQTYKTKINF